MCLEQFGICLSVGYTLISIAMIGIEAVWQGCTACREIMEITPEVLEKIREKFRENSFPTLVGIEIESIENGRARLAMDVTEKHLQLQGIMHGGAIATLIDTAVAMAILGASEPGDRFTTIEMKINYLSPVREGRVFADAKLIRDGRRIVVAECDVFEPRGRLAAKGLLTYMRLV